MMAPAFLSSLHVNSTVHSFMQTGFYKKKRIRKETASQRERGPLKLCTCVVLGEKKIKTTLKMSQATQNPFELSKQLQKST